MTPSTPAKAAKKKTAKKAVKKTVKAAKKKTAKKAVKKTGGARSKKAAEKQAALVVSAKKILPQLQAGKTTLTAASLSLGLSSNTPLRGALTELCGGKEKYREMLTGGKKKQAKSK